MAERHGNRPSLARVPHLLDGRPEKSHGCSPRREELEEVSHEQIS